MVGLGARWLKSRGMRLFSRDGGREMPMCSIGFLRTGAHKMCDLGFCLRSELKFLKPARSITTHRHIRSSDPRNLLHIATSVPEPAADGTNGGDQDVRVLGYEQRRPMWAPRTRLLTNDKSVPYPDYVANLKRNELARAVKLADLAHNSDPTRLPKVTQADRERAGKYRRAIALLSD